MTVHHGAKAGGSGYQISDVMILSSRPTFLTLLAISILCSISHAQDNYEIQVYGSYTQAPRSTMVEIHSNFTVEGSKTVIDGMLPTNHA